MRTLHIGSAGAALRTGLGAVHEQESQLRREYGKRTELAVGYGYRGCPYCLERYPRHGNTHSLPNGQDAACHNPVELDHTGGRVA